MSYATYTQGWEAVMPEVWDKNYNAEVWIGYNDIEEEE